MRLETRYCHISSTDAEATARVISRALAAPYVPAVVAALSAIPNAAESLFAALRPAFERGVVEQCSSRIRDAVARQQGVRFSDHMAQLKQQGASREDVRQIRYLVEVVQHVEPACAILAAVGLRLWGLESAPEHGVHLPRQSIIRSLLAEWPGYEELVRSECTQTQRERALSEGVMHISLMAVQLAQDVPVSPTLPHGCSVPTSLLLDSLRQSSEASVISASLRRSYIRHEEEARERHASPLV